MNKIFVGIAQYILRHPECKDKQAYDIFNAYFAIHPYTPKSVEDLKLILDYISRVKGIPNTILTDAMRGEDRK